MHTLGYHENSSWSKKGIFLCLLWSLNYILKQYTKERNLCIFVQFISYFRLLVLVASHQKTKISAVNSFLCLLFAEKINFLLVIVVKSNFFVPFFWRYHKRHFQLTDLYMQLRSNETRLHLILWQGWSIFTNAFSQKNFTPFKPIHFLCNVSFPLQVFWSQNIKSSLRWIIQR